MKGSLALAITLVIISLFITPVSGDIADLHIQVENNLGAPFYMNFSLFENYYTGEGADVVMNDEYTEPRSQIDALLVTHPLFTTGSEIDEITSWFADDTTRLLWITGSSDFNAEYHANLTNEILSNINSHIRISDEQVQEPNLNDGFPYRLISNTTVKDGKYNTIITENVESAIFHGPAPLYVVQNGQSYHPDKKQIENVEIIMKTSSEAEIRDEPTYSGFYSTENITDGNFPVMMIEAIDDEHFVIVSGDTIYSDYKNMYGTETEYKVWGDHQGKILVDNIFSWFAEIKDDVNENTVPIHSMIFFSSLVIIAITIRRFRK